MGLLWKNLNLHFALEKDIVFLENTKNGKPRPILVSGLLLNLLRERRANQQVDALICWDWYKKDRKKP